MLKITIECEGTGAELREELISLLIGGNAPGLQIVQPSSVRFSEATNPDPVQEESLVEPEAAATQPEKPKRQSRKATTVETPVEETTPEPPVEEEQTETPAKEETAPTITLEQLTAKALELNREKKKAETVAILKEFDAESFSLKGSDKPLKPEHYAAVWEKLNAL